MKLILFNVMMLCCVEYAPVIHMLMKMLQQWCFAGAGPRQIVLYGVKSSACQIDYAICISQGLWQLLNDNSIAAADTRPHQVVVVKQVHFDY